MLHEKHQDPIDVIAVFEKNKALPRAFKWGKHTYKISKILNVHSTFHGRERVFFFSVSTEADFFRLELHCEDLRWMLVEHYQD